MARGIGARSGNPGAHGVGTAQQENQQRRQAPALGAHQRQILEGKPAGLALRLRTALGTPGTQFFHRALGKLRRIGPEQEIPGASEQGSNRHLIGIDIHAPGRPNTGNVGRQAGTHFHLEQAGVRFIDFRTG